jgi:hypothetical protein
MLARWTRVATGMALAALIEIAGQGVPKRDRKRRQEPPMSRVERVRAQQDRRKIRRAAARDRRTGSRALVAFAPATAGPEPSLPRVRPSAEFLAQLIATRDQAPQTRQRRRAEPADAIAAYAAAIKRFEN